MRILVTGSRTWTDASMIANALVDAVGDADPADVTVVHGDHPFGADALADHAATELGLTVEPHPAEWKRYGPAAGPKRNASMVAAGADICLAFYHGPSRGTRDCANRARYSGIPVVAYEQSS